MIISLTLSDFVSWKVFSFVLFFFFCFCIIAEPVHLANWNKVVSEYFTFINVLHFSWGLWILHASIFPKMLRQTLRLVIVVHQPLIFLQPKVPVAAMEVRACVCVFKCCSSCQPAACQSGIYSKRSDHLSVIPTVLHIWLRQRLTVLFPYRLKSSCDCFRWGAARTSQWNKAALAALTHPLIHSIYLPTQ